MSVKLSSSSCSSSSYYNDVTTSSTCSDEVFSNSTCSALAECLRLKKKPNVVGSELNHVIFRDGTVVRLTDDYINRNGGDAVALAMEIITETGGSITSVFRFCGKSLVIWDDETFATIVNTDNVDDAWRCAAASRRSDRASPLVLAVVRPNSN